MTLSLLTRNVVTIPPSRLEADATAFGRISSKQMDGAAHEAEATREKNQGRRKRTILERVR